MIIDRKKLARTAQRLIVETRSASGSPPAYETRWQAMYGAKVDQIDINAGTKPSVATIWFPASRWNQTLLRWGDAIRIRTNELNSSARTILFSGFYVKKLSEFSGSAFERNAAVCVDFRWLLSVTSPVYGQLIRTADDHTNYGLLTQAIIKGSYTKATARRCVFNANGKPNKDPVPLSVQDDSGKELCTTYIFGDYQSSIWWTAREMIIYLLCKINNEAYDYFPLADPSAITGLDHPDFDRILNNVTVDGLNKLEDVELICKHLNFSFRPEHNNNGTDSLVFYKLAAASDYARSDTQPTILHRPYAPVPGENIAAAVLRGEKLLWAAKMSEDITSVINTPIAIGAPDRYEFSAELVPAWFDADLIPDSADSYANLFLTEKMLTEISSPDDYSYYNYYHKKGANFNSAREVGRKWALNESGKYAIAYSWAVDQKVKKGDIRRFGASTYRSLHDHITKTSNQPQNNIYWTSSVVYDRSTPFDFASVLDPVDVFDSVTGKRNFGPFARKLLPCLTVDNNSENSVGIKVFFSFDSGDTWQPIDASIKNLNDECGIYIDEPNLAEIVDARNRTISSGDLAKIELNMWTSLCDDNLNSRVYGNWLTRCMITASVQMDRRMVKKSPIDLSATGSPFNQSQLFDFSDKYGVQKRSASSTFDGSTLAARNIDDGDWLEKHIQGIRQANEDMAISGIFTFERLWLGDGSGEPEFMLGDGIEKITGRNYPLASALGTGKVYPEIIKIEYLPDKQKMLVVTRDSRYVPDIIDS